MENKILEKLLIQNANLNYDKLALEVRCEELQAQLDEATAPNKEEETDA